MSSEEEDSEAWKKGYSSITIFWYETVYIGEWKFKNLRSWDVIEHSETGDPIYPNQVVFSGETSEIDQQIINIFTYLTKLSKEGVGRYKLHINRDYEGYVEYLIGDQ